MKKVLPILAIIIATVIFFSPRVIAKDTDLDPDIPKGEFSFDHLPSLDYIDKLKIDARLPIHVQKARTGKLVAPAGRAPVQIQTAYNLPATGGSGIIAVVDAYDNPNAERDLGTFSTQFNLPPCATLNGCFIKHKMSSFIFRNSGWILEESLDVQWAHALAPSAKVMLVEARSARLSDLLSAVAWAKQQPGVVAVSLSWGANEFSGEGVYDSYFTQPGVSFFAASGDSGNGVLWPSVSSNVTSVGGTTLILNSNNTVSSETAWAGSGGGISTQIAEPAYQTAFGIPNTNNMRAVPDVSFDADPATGVSVYDSYGYGGQYGWFIIGGTSVGAPSWSAIHALHNTGNNTSFYADAKSNYANFFRDITSGTNGTCGTVCTASVGYDFVTGLGSPFTSSY